LIGSQRPRSLDRGLRVIWRTARPLCITKEDRPTFFSAGPGAPRGCARSHDRCPPLRKLPPRIPQPAAPSLSCELFPPTRHRARASLSCVVTASRKCVTPPFVTESSAVTSAVSRLDTAHRAVKSPHPALPTSTASGNWQLHADDRLAHPGPSSF